MEQVVLRIQIGGFSAEVSGPPEYAEKKLDELIKKYGPSRSINSKGQQSISAMPGGKQKSPSEFIKKVSPKNQTDRALVLAYYLEKVENKESFSTTDLADISQKAKQPKFTNISDTVARAVQQGLLMGAGEKENKRVFVLTTTGEEYVDGLLSSKQQ